MNDVYLNQLGLICPLGNDIPTVSRRLSVGDRAGLVLSDRWHPGHPSPLGQVTGQLPELPADLSAYRCRNNRLLVAAFEQLRPTFEHLARGLSRARIGVVLGTSTAGIDRGELAQRQWQQHQPAPQDYHYLQQQLGSGSDFLARYAGLEGPSLTISTACSSSARALASARALIRNDVCDLVVAGGADSLCQLTVQGFHSLNAVSKQLCNPFSIHRDGINIGEAAALFLVSRTPGPVLLAGVGASSDAHHISGPDPSGEGAVAAMQAALDDARVRPTELGYLNLHGTATPQNDSMEAKAVDRLFQPDLACSSTKALTGHCLGAAGALEAAFCWLLLKDSALPLPPHRFDGHYDPVLPPLNLVGTTQRPRHLQYCLSNSFAFGGNNLSLLLEAV